MTAYGDAVKDIVHPTVTELCGVRYLGKNKKHTMPDPVDGAEVVPSELGPDGKAMDCRPDWRLAARSVVNMPFLKRVIAVVLGNEKHKLESKVSIQSFMLFHRVTR